MTDLKALKKLADACRKAGIKHYKDTNMEFTLTDDAPVSTYKKKKSVGDLDQEYTIPTDSLTEEQLLFYSVADIQGGQS
jgi:hypothetical protein